MTELITAAAREAETLADQVTGSARKRLQVLAHVLRLAERELTAEPRPSADPELAAAIRAGDHDADLLTLAAPLRPAVRAELAVVHPGYDRPPK